MFAELVILESFLKGLVKDVQLLVRVAAPKTLEDAYEKARVVELAFQSTALAMQWRATYEAECYNHATCLTSVGSVLPNFVSPSNSHETTNLCGILPANGPFVFGATTLPTTSGIPHGDTSHLDSHLGGLESSHPMRKSSTDRVRYVWRRKKL